MSTIERELQSIHESIFPYLSYEESKITFTGKSGETRRIKMITQKGGEYRLDLVAGGRVIVFGDTVITLSK